MVDMMNQVQASWWGVYPGQLYDSTPCWPCKFTGLVQFHGKQLIITICVPYLCAKFLSWFAPIPHSNHQWIVLNYICQQISVFKINLEHFFIALRTLQKVGHDDFRLAKSIWTFKRHCHLAVRRSWVRGPRQPMSAQIYTRFRFQCFLHPSIQPQQVNKHPGASGFVPWHHTLPLLCARCLPQQMSALSITEFPHQLLSVSAWSCDAGFNPCIHIHREFKAKSYDIVFHCLGMLCDCQGDRTWCQSVVASHASFFTPVR